MIENSLFLWSFLVKHFDLLKKLECHFSVYNDDNEYDVIEKFNTPDYFWLKFQPWLMDKNGRFVSPQSINKSQLSPEYLSIPGSDSLCEFLGILDPPVPPVIEATKIDSTPTRPKKTYEQLESENQDLTTENQNKDAKIAELEAKLAEFERIEEERKQRKLARSQHVSHHNQINSQDDNENDLEQSKISLDETRISHVSTQIVKRLSESDVKTEFKIDQDDNDKRINRVRQSYDNKLNTLKKLKSLEIIAEGLNRDHRYSFKWFKTLLEIEMLKSSDDKYRRKTISIVFNKIKPESGTERTFILIDPRNPIPPNIEELSGFPMSLQFGKQTKDNIIVEAVSIRSFTLRVKLRDVDQIRDIDLEQVSDVRITAQNPDFLLQKLIEGFNELNFSDDYCLKQNLTSNIKFIFGPPGTGKTTELCRNYLLKWMKETYEYKVLVLTPTNKSADVIVNRLISLMNGDSSYRDWLIRFGPTTDEQIDKCGVTKIRNCEFSKYNRSIVVTTIARYPYDYFWEGKKNYLKDIQWDYIVIDEASMISLANMVYPLYKSNTGNIKRFIIAGDPNQIQPIVKCEYWKDMNIYSMVELESFSAPTDPDKVHKLPMQYRSIPCIGELFSRLAYDGVLKHSRNSDSIKPLNIQSFIDLKPLNIINFRTSRFESIYKCKRLQNSSPYQIYSALFTYEFTHWLSKLLANNNPNIQFSIVIISPYKIQASLVDRLLARTDISRNINILADTVHGFQGDECDIVIALFNPPPSIAPNSFINNKNIVNVAISRARDYLIMLMPVSDDDNNIELQSELTLINRLKSFMVSDRDNFKEFSATEIESLMFDNNSHYLEENTFSTNHQSVNVYAKPEKKYEVRCEDSAIDIQIHIDTPIT